MIRIVYIALAIVGCSAHMDAQLLGTPLQYWDFANGIPSTWQNGSDSGIGIWEYRGPNTVPNNEVCSRGSCGSGTIPPPSLSWANGFVIFDSNYWDDDDDLCGGLGTGQDPAPHTAWLITEPIDLSSATGAVITFQQQVRMFQASTRLQISVNNGNWTDVVVNTVNNSPAVEWRSGNISAAAAGQSNVRFRFLFTGTYYHWCVDDIYVYQPNQNDVQLNSATYTNFGQGGLATPVSDMEYDQYPTFFLRPFNFRSRAQNIGSQAASSVRMNVRILNSANTQIYNQNSNTVSNLNPGSQTTLTISTAYNPPTQLGHYRMIYNILMTQTDQNPNNNIDTLDFRVTPFTYARDEGPMENVFVPQSNFTGERLHIGNFFETRASGYRLGSIAAAVGTGTAPGTVIKGYVYNYDLNTILAETQPYTVNIADINSLGQEKILTLPFTTPFTLVNDSIYCVMIGNVDGSQPLRVCRSGRVPDNTSFVRYPDSFGLFYLLTAPVVRMNIFPAGVIAGCTDAQAMNYNALATTTDNSCRYPGCTNPQASNFNPSANWDNGTCLVAGCTNPLADNYNPLATSDDGSCVISGCTNPLAANYDPNATVENGSCLFPGCTDPTANNYDTSANDDDGSCIYLGCIDPAAANYNPSANQDDGSCIYPGCTNPEADNFDPQANSEDGSCIYTVAGIFTSNTQGCVPYTVTVINQTVVADESTCVFVISDGTIVEGCVASLTHTFTEPGDYFITLEYTTETGFSTDMVGPIHVSAYPATPELSEEDGTLSCTNCEADSFIWRYNGEIIPNAQSNSYTAFGNGQYLNGYYTLTATNTAGCAATSESNLVFYVQFDASPLLGCVPFEVTLLDQTVHVAGMSREFNVDGTSYPTQPGPFTVEIPEDGEIEITLTGILGDETAFESQTIIAYPLISPELSLNEQTGAVVCSNCAGQNTEWFVNGEPVGTNLLSLNSADGLVEVTLNGPGGCSATSSIFVVSVNELNQVAVVLYPNPADRQCVIEADFSIRRIEVIDQAGRVVMRREMAQTRFVLDTAALSNGLYLIVIDGDGQSVRQRLAIGH